MICRKKFTLIEVLAVLLIFGIVASIGLSLSRTVPVKDATSNIASLINISRSYSIKEQRYTKLKFDQNTFTAELWILKHMGDISDSSHWEKAPVKNFQNTHKVSLNFYSDKELSNLITENPELIFSTNGSPTTLLSQENIKGIEVYDPNNTRHKFLISIQTSGKYLIHED